MLVDLNYNNLKVYPKRTYPDTLFCRKLDPDGEYELEKLDAPHLEDVWETTGKEENTKYFGNEVCDIRYGVLQSLLLISRHIHGEVEVFAYAKPQHSRSISLAQNGA